MNKAMKASRQFTFVGQTLNYRTGTDSRNDETSQKKINKDRNGEKKNATEGGATKREPNEEANLSEFSITIIVIH